MVESYVICLEWAKQRLKQKRERRLELSIHNFAIYCKIQNQYRSIADQVRSYYLSQSNSIPHAPVISHF